MTTSIKRISQDMLDPKSRFNEGIRWLQDDPVNAWLKRTKAWTIDTQAQYLFLALKTIVDPRGEGDDDVDEIVAYAKVDYDPRDPELVDIGPVIVKPGLSDRDFDCESFIRRIFASLALGPPTGRKPPSIYTTRLQAADPDRKDFRPACRCFYGAATKQEYPIFYEGQQSGLGTGEWIRIPRSSSSTKSSPFCEDNNDELKLMFHASPTVPPPPASSRSSLSSVPPSSSSSSLLVETPSSTSLLSSRLPIVGTTTTTIPSILPRGPTLSQGSTPTLTLTPTTLSSLSSSVSSSSSSSSSLPRPTIRPLTTTTKTTKTTTTTALSRPVQNVLPIDFDNQRALRLLDQLLQRPENAEWKESELLIRPAAPGDRTLLLLSRNEILAFGQVSAIQGDVGLGNRLSLFVKPSYQERFLAGDDGCQGFAERVLTTQLQQRQRPAYFSVFAGDKDDATAMADCKCLVAAGSRLGFQRAQLQEAVPVTAEDCTRLEGEIEMWPPTPSSSSSSSSLSSLAAVSSPTPVSLSSTPTTELTLPSPSTSPFTPILPLLPLSSPPPLLPTTQKRKATITSPIEG